MTVINSWDQMVAAGGDRIAIYYNGPEARAISVARYQVVRLVNGYERQTDPMAAWYDYHKKTFVVDYPLREGKPIALAEAIAWVAETYGERDFVRNRLGDYVEREINERFPIPKHSNQQEGNSGKDSSG